MAFIPLTHRASRLMGAVLGGLLACAAVSAHVVLQDPVATAGGSYRATLLVTHGCEGSPVTEVAVLIPAGFRGAKPMPKAGWKLSIVKQPLDKPYSSHGKPITEDVSELRWTALTPEAWLPDGAFDEFVLRGQLPDAPGPLWFKVKQSCAEGAIDWAQIPAEGTNTRGLKTPAALLEVQPNPHAGHEHMH